MTDSYKASHWKLYPPDTRGLYGYLAARGGAYPRATLFGLQVLLDRFFSRRITYGDVRYAKEFWAQHLGRIDVFNEKGFRRIVREHGGWWPVEIYAVPEGTMVPTGHPLLVVRSTDPELPWVTTYLETVLDQLWYPSTVATRSAMIRATVMGSLEATGSPELIDTRVHDFGFRGSTSIESAGLGGAAHLLSFTGTDTLPGLLVAREHYSELMAGCSIPAAEHSTVTAWGRDGELEAYRHALRTFPNGYLAVVSDSYDVFAACQHWSGELGAVVTARDGVLVVRPDSGDPAATVLRVLHILGEGFGTTMNEKGYRVLYPKVRVIQGDGIDHHAIASILSQLATASWSADNLAFGSGGGLLQKVDRDTLGFTFKASAVKTDDSWVPIQKDPVTDAAKRSLAGTVDLVRTGRDPDGYGRFETRNERTESSAMHVVYRNGIVFNRTTFAEVRARIQTDDR